MVYVLLSPLFPSFPNPTFHVPLLERGRILCGDLIADLVRDIAGHRYCTHEALGTSKQVGTRTTD